MVNCSIAPARNVSPAAMTHVFPCFFRRLATLPMESVLPVPFTPINIITTGFLLFSINSLKSKSLVFKTCDIAFLSTVSTKSPSLARVNGTSLISSLISFFIDSITE